jgi:hypothetical protein
MLAPLIKTSVISSGTVLPFGAACGSLSIVLEGQIECWLPVPKQALALVFSELQKYVDNDYPHLAFETDSDITLSQIISHVRRHLH